MGKNLSSQMRKPSSPLSESIDSFLKGRHDLEPSTLAGYARSLRRFQHWLNDPPLSALTEDNVNAYASMKIRAGKKYLARGDVATLRVFARWMYRTGKSKSDPLATLILPKRPPSERTAVPNRDVRTALELSSTSREGIRDKAIMLLAATHGLRLNEVRELEYADLDFANGTLRIRAETTKTHAGIRTIPLGRETIAALDSYIKDERGPNPGPFFQTRHGRKFTYSGFSKVSWRLGQKLEALGISDFKFHRLRHSWATNYVHQPGVTIFDLQQVGGWKDINSAQVYVTRRSVDELRRLPVVSYGRV